MNQKSSIIQILKSVPRVLTSDTDHYIAGAYLIDPFYSQSKDIKVPVLSRMREIAPRDFDTSEYFISYYKQSNVIDELNYLVPFDEERVFVISFERSALYPPFSELEIDECAAHLPVIAALITQHVTMPGSKLPTDTEDSEHKRLEEVLRQFGADVLTPRECEVVQLMLGGHSAASIARELVVSVETVRVHRRNIYEKLKISSLAELFSLVLKAIYSSAKIEG